MELDCLLSMLEAKDTSQAFEALKEMERISANANVFYPYMDRFVAMVSSEKYVIRVRGFRLFCKQARWDVYNKVDENIDAVLSILNDDKPTAVRQALAALHDVVRHKKALIDTVRNRALAIDYMRYKDTMHSLISGDIQKLLMVMEQEENLGEA